MVVETNSGRMITIEGNTNDGGSRNGIGVFKRDARKINQINKGFIDYKRTLASNASFKVCRQKIKPRVKTLRILITR